MTLQTAERAGLPDMSVSVRQVFGIDTNLEVPAYSRPDEHVPDVDPDYLFNRDVTLAILAGFKHNRRVMIQGYHGTGKSTHVEQVAARLNWPCIRINLDSHVSRIDLVGKDAIVLKEGKQVTEFREGILPYALQTNTALCFDEYDAGRPDVMFVGQAHPARPIEGDPPASRVPAVLDHQHHRARRHLRPLPRHPADQPRADGPLVDRLHAQLFAPR
jgi:cobaltochelatase CobS